MLLQSGIIKINYLRNYHNDQYAVELLKRKNVEIKQIKFSEDDLDKININHILREGE